MWRGTALADFCTSACSWAEFAYNWSAESLTDGCGRSGGQAGIDRRSLGVDSRACVYVNQTSRMGPNPSKLSTFAPTFPQHFPSYPQAAIGVEVH